MAITHSLAFRGSRSRHEWEGGPRYTSVYNVRTDDPLTQSQEVINWFRQNVVNLEDQYQFANDTFGSQAICQAIDCDRREGSLYDWTVIAEYWAPDRSTQKPPRLARTDSGNLSEDPLEWRFEIETGGSLYSETAFESEYISGLNGALEIRKNIQSGDRFMACNSALIPLDPPLSRDQWVPWLRVRKNDVSYNPDIEDWVNAANSTALSIDFAGYQNNWEVNELRLAHVRARLERRVLQKSGVEREYWAHEWLFETKRNIYDPPGSTFHVGGGWDDWTPDRGSEAKAETDDPDGRGGTIAAESMIEGMPGVRRLVDLDLYPLQHDHYFDGAGQPIRYSGPGGPNPLEVVRLRYRNHQLTDFTAFPLVGGLFT